MRTALVLDIAWVVRAGQDGIAQMPTVARATNSAQDRCVAQMVRLADTRFVAAVGGVVQERRVALGNRNAAVSAPNWSRAAETFRGG